MAAVKKGHSRKHRGSSMSGKLGKKAPKITAVWSPTKVYYRQAPPSG